MGCICRILCNIALKRGDIGKKLPQKLVSTHGALPRDAHENKRVAGNINSHFLRSPSWHAKKTHDLQFLTNYCIGLHNPYQALSYTYGKLWAWRSQRCMPFFMFFVFSHCIFVFCKKCIFLFYWPNLTNQHCELPRKIYKPDFSKKCWFCIVSASLGKKSRSPTEVVSGPV